MHVLFLADQLATDERSDVERHPGGAELTDAAAIEACPHPIDVRRTTEVDPAAVGSYDVIVVANAGRAAPALLDSVARTGRHVLFEHDLRICDWRGNFPIVDDDDHRLAQRCTCRHDAWQPVLERALGLVYLSHRQRAAYHANPHFRPGRERVLGQSLFGRATLEEVVQLALTDRPRSGAVVLGSPSAFKGRPAALDWCATQGWEVTELRDQPHLDALGVLARAEHLVFLPVGMEAAGRLPVEARLVGCSLVLNGQLGITDEPLWALSGPQALHALADGPALFWRLVQELVDASGPESPGPVVPVTTAVAERQDLRQRVERWALRPRAHQVST